LFDTNVYFHTLQDLPYLRRYRPALLRVAPHTYLSSVVRLELVQGARGDVARARVGKAVEPLERAGRVVAPTHADWTQAGVVQGRIRDDRPSSRTKSLQNDLLIVCSARRIGAMVITENVEDFDTIRRYLPHQAVTLEGLARHLGV
jgi:predicted nucleic acid-binding protein